MVLCSCLLLAAPAGASSWPATGGGPARAGAQPVEPGALPAPVEWAFADPAGAMGAPVVADGDGAAAQHVVYATTDGRVHVRALDTGAEIASTLIDDDGGRGVVPAQSSSDTGLVVAGGAVFVPHDDGAGVEIARLDERTGARLGPDVAVPDSLGCTVAGAPLLTPVAADGSRVLVFTETGSCGSALIRVGVQGTELGAIARTPVSGLVAGVPAAQVIIGVMPQFAFAVARTLGLDLIGADGRAAGTVELDETPAAIAAPETAGAATPAVVVVGSQHVYRLVQGADGVLRVTATVPGRGTSVAVGGASDARVAIAGPDGLLVLRSDLSAVGTAPGSFTAVSAGGDVAYAVSGGRLVAVDLNTPAVTDLGVAATTAPALARGYVVTGPAALLTTDVTAPAVTLTGDVRHAEAHPTDDRGVAAVDFHLGRLSLGTVTHAPFAITPDTRKVTAGAYTLDAAARDAAGNVAHASLPVTLTCRQRRGTRRADRIRGGKARDCIRAGRGRDRIDVRGGGADIVHCGPGPDQVRADRFDRVIDDCERVRRH